MIDVIRVPCQTAVQYVIISVGNYVNMEKVQKCILAGIIEGKGVMKCLLEIFAVCTLLL